MGYEIPGFQFSLPSNIDMSVAATYQYTPVTVVAASGAGINTPAAVQPVASSGDPIVGILQNNPQLAEAATLVQTGISKVLSLSAIAVGAKLGAAPAGGVGLAYTGAYVIGIALEAATAANQYITALIVNLGKL